MQVNALEAILGGDIDCYIKILSRLISYHYNNLILPETLKHVIDHF